MTETVVGTIETELQRYFAASRLRATDYGDHYVALWDSFAKASAGGKRGRPALVLSAYAGFGGSDLAVATPVAVSFELLHTAFIIHDDIIDCDVTRRGNPNVAGEFSERAIGAGVSAETATTWATTAAVLAGDLALSEAHRTLAILPIAAETRGLLLDLLDHSVFVSAAGELADVTNASADSITLDAVLTTLEHKTAVYSFEAPLQAGAILAEAPQEALVALGCFGRLIGVAFQITDDILGVFGDPSATGKSILADLREGKRTVMIAHARSTALWRKIAPFIGKKNLTEDEAASVRELLIACGADAAARRAALDYSTRAVESLDSPAIPEPLRIKLVELARTAVERAT